MAIGLVAMGGNLGDPAAAIHHAMQLLNQHTGIRVLAVSSLFSTTPVGTQAGGGFVNAAARLEVELSPWDLLDVLQKAEQLAGRVRTTHWGPRTLDLDLIGFDDLTLQDPRLQVPHPACWYRRFVLDPLEEVAADWQHPVQRLTVTQLLDRLRPRPLPVSLQLPSAVVAELVPALAAAFPGQWRLCEQPREAALTLTETGRGGVRAIPVAPEATPAAMVEILRGVLDEPRRISSPLGEHNQ